MARKMNRALSWLKCAWRHFRSRADSNEDRATTEIAITDRGRLIVLVSQTKMTTGVYVDFIQEIQSLIVRSQPRGFDVAGLLQQAPRPIFPLHLMRECLNDSSSRSARWALLCRSAESGTHP